MSDFQTKQAKEMKKQPKQKNVIDWLRKLPKTSMDLVMPHGCNRTYYKKADRLSRAILLVCEWNEADWNSFAKKLYEDAKRIESHAKQFKKPKAVISPDGLSENGEGVIW